MEFALPKGEKRGKIIVTGDRIKCPACGTSLPDRFEPDSVAWKVITQCKRCKREYEVYTSDPRPSAPSVH